MTDTTKPCPKCHEPIQQEAKKCKHCWSYFKNWILRHPIWSIIIFLVFMAFWWAMWTNIDSNSSIDTPQVWNSIIQEKNVVQNTTSNDVDFIKKIQSLSSNQSVVTSLTKFWQYIQLMDYSSALSSLNKFYDEVFVMKESMPKYTWSSKNLINAETSFNEALSDYINAVENLRPPLNALITWDTSNLEKNLDLMNKWSTLLNLWNDKINNVAKLITAYYSEW